MNVESFEYVLTAPQVDSSHSPRFVAVCKWPLQHQASTTQQSFAAFTANPLPKQKFHVSVMSYLQPAAILGDVNLDRYPRVALFTDCFEESDRMSRTSRQLDEFASRNGLPFLTIHSGATNNFERIAESRYLRLERSRIAFRFDGELFFDPLLLRHYSTVREVLADFRAVVALPSRRDSRYWTWRRGIAWPVLLAHGACSAGRLMAQECT